MRTQSIIITFLLALVLTLVLSPKAHGKAHHHQAPLAPMVVKTQDESMIRVGGATRTLGSAANGTAMICHLSAFFSVDSADRIITHANLDGRGLMSCHNNEGFLAEYPVTADLSVEFPAGYKSDSEFTVSANSSSFVVARDMSDAQDSYEIRDFARAAPAPIQQASMNGANSSHQQILLRGQKNDLTIQMDLNSPTQSLDKIKVTSLNLHYDDSAPDLR